MWPSCNPDKKICDGGVEICGVSKTGNLRSFDDYKWEFNLEIDKLADEYDMNRKEGTHSNHIWEYCNHETGQKHGKRHGAFAFVYDFLHSINDHRSEVELSSNGSVVKHVCSACIYLVSFVKRAKEIFPKEKFPSSQIGTNVGQRNFYWDDHQESLVTICLCKRFLEHVEFKGFEIVEIGTYGFVKSEKRLEAYSLKEWKHIVLRNERWSSSSSFMEETLFKGAVRLPKFFIHLSSTMDSR
ncbi:hypothetical protein Tco_0862976 [Tanacetum coccineum]